MHVSSTHRDQIPSPSHHTHTTMISHSQRRSSTPIWLPHLLLLISFLPLLSADESAAMLNLSQSLQVPGWTGKDPCTWTGVTCNRLSGDVENIHLRPASASGSLPDIFSSLPSLTSLRLSNNNISGCLPPSLAASSLRYLHLNNAHLSGNLHVVSQMTNLLQVWVHVNKFTGPLPDLANCTSLFDAQFRDNQLTGVIPSSLQSHQSLRNLSLGNNKLQGPSPEFPTTVKYSLGNTNNFCKRAPGPCDTQVTTLLEVVAALGYPQPLAEAWKGNDACDGWMFVSCDAKKKSVTSINFGKQQFSGTISPSLANLTQLVTIKLNDNNISGTIPQSLTSLEHLTLLDVSNNNISGRVPTFPSGIKIQADGNAFIGQDLSPQATDGENTNGSAKLPTLLGIILVFVILLMVVLVFLILLCLKRRHQNLYWRGEEEKKAKNISGKRSYDLKVVISGSSDGSQLSIPIEVLTEITDRFSPDKIIGRGGFGVVYRAELPHDGTPVAVKRIYNCSGPEDSEGLRQFHSELSVLTTVRYRHLVSMLGYCVSENERFVVYEFMSQGTLDQHLFEPRERGFEPLTWVERLRIALDVARGIEYLHKYGPKNTYIHRDLKPSNILLGDDLRAKVSDFGLVKTTLDGSSSMHTKLAGTFGYLAPEYAATGRVTTKIDVYAFGAVLMELLTGRRALEKNMPDNKCHLVSWLRKYLSDKATIREHIRNYLDPSLVNPEQDTPESIYVVAELAGYCTVKDPNLRPDMGHVVNTLAPLVEKWAPSATDTEDEDNSFGVGFSLSLPEALKRWQAEDEDDDKKST